MHLLLYAKKTNLSMDYVCGLATLGLGWMTILILLCPDDSAAFHGAPIGLQLMCRRTEEEKALKLVEMIMQAQAQSLAFLA